MATQHSDRLEELLPAYALGALDGEDLRELEEHLADGCGECRHQIDLWRHALEALAESTTPVQPSEITRARVLRLAAGALAPMPPMPVRMPARSLSRWLPFAAAALLLLGVWSVAGQIRMRGELRRLSDANALLARRLEGLSGDVAQARFEARRASQALQILAAPHVNSVVLAGLGPTPGAAGHTYVNPQTRDALFYAFNLPALAPDKTYQLWFIADGKPVSAGTFSVDPRGTGTLRVDKVADVKDIQAWAVTVEPRGGVPQPTGEMVLKG
jgi:anti-sigma-K factor RskA